MALEVDRTIPPHATGAAAELAAAHAAEHPLKLYAGWFCPFVQRAWVVLQEKRIPYQYIEINPYHKSAEFLALNPRGLVPTLAVPRPTTTRGGEGTGQKERELKPLYESTVVCEYLDEAYADESLYGPRLLPADDPYERARCRIWIDHICGKIVPAFYKLLQHTPSKPYSLDQARRELHTGILTFVREMMIAPEEEDQGQRGGPWFLGDRFSLVDVCLAPWAKRLWIIDHYKSGGTGIPPPSPPPILSSSAAAAKSEAEAEAEAPGQEQMGGDGEEEEEKKAWARWRVWLDAVVERESLRDTFSDEEEYLVVYRRYAEDTTNSLVGQATRKGEKLP